MTTVAEKAARLLEQDAVEITTRTDDVVVALVEGDTGRWRVTLSSDGAFAGCSCPAIGDCSHIAAVQSLISQSEPPGTDAAPLQPTTTAARTDDALGRQIVEESGPHTPDEEPGPGRLVTGSPDPTSGFDEPAGSTVGGPPEGVDVDPETGEILPAVPDETDASLVAIADMPVSWKTLHLISRTEFAPVELRGRPAALLACVLTGREWGLGPMESLRSIDVIEGRPSPSSELLARAIRTAGGQIEVLEMSDKAVRLKGTRPDTGETLEVGFTLEDAARAGLVTIDEEGRPRAVSRNGHPLPWQSWTSDLLWARAITRLWRRLWPDVRHVTPTNGKEPTR